MDLDIAGDPEIYLSNKSESVTVRDIALVVCLNEYLDADDKVSEFMCASECDY